MWWSGSPADSGKTNRYKDFGLMNINVFMRCGAGIFDDVRLTLTKCIFDVMIKLPHSVIREERFYVILGGCR